MFLVVWEPDAFNQMDAIVRWYPARRQELARSLRILVDELDRESGQWGESRDNGFRLGFPGVLSVLIHVDVGEHVIRIAQIKLR